MERGYRLGIVLALTCIFAAATLFCLTPPSRARGWPAELSDAGQAAQPRANVTLHANAGASRLRFSDAPDLPESSATIARVVAEMAVDLDLDGAMDLVTLRNTAHGAEIQVRMGNRDGGLG